MCGDAIVFDILYTLVLHLALSDVTAGGVYEALCAVGRECGLFGAVSGSERKIQVETGSISRKSTGSRKNRSALRLCVL